MNDMRQVIEPKSDQLNADDLLTGPRTIKIREVTIRPGTEQPVSIFFDGDNGKPYKCCKSMARVLVRAWGPDANKYVGRSMTIYCDPKVKWGGMEVGGVRISHMSDIGNDILMALTATKGKKAPFIVKPLAQAAPPESHPEPAPQPPVANPPTGGAPSPLDLPFIHGNITKSCTSRPAFLGMMEAVFLSGTDPDDMLECFFANQPTLNDLQAFAFERVDRAKTEKAKTEAQAVLSRITALFDQAHQLQKKLAEPVG